MPAVAKLPGVADRCNNSRGGNRTDTRNLGDLPAERRRLHERLDRCLNEMNTLLYGAQVLQQFGEERLAKRGQFMCARAQQFRYDALKASGEREIASPRSPSKPRI